MQGKKRLISGLLMIIFGAVVLYLGYSALNFIIAAVGWGLLLFGAMITIMGAGTLYASLNNPAGAIQHDMEKVEVRALVHALGEIAAADGQIDRKEVKAISAQYKEIFGVRISDSEMDEILFDMDENLDVIGELKQMKPRLNLETRRHIVHACHCVMMSDELASPFESEKIAAIGAALGFSATEIGAIIAS